MSNLTPKPSKYQTAVLDFVRKGKGHAFVSAVAGSGKTTTLRMICDVIVGMGGAAAFMAFNKHIATELSAKLPQSVTVGTIHQFGLRACASGLGRRCFVDVKAVDEMIRKHIDAYLDDKFRGQEFTEELRKEMEGLRTEARNLVRFVKSSAIDFDDPGQIQDVMDRFDIDMPVGDATSLMPRILRDNIALARKGTINFDDMIWLPVHLGFRPQQFKWLMVDEAQDLTPAQRKLAMAMIAPGGRAIFVGDSRQAIYAFCGADSRSVQEIISALDAKILPLSVCYRCPASHVAMAADIVPEIEAAPGADRGEILHLPSDGAASYAEIDDLILCRTTAPLIEEAYNLIGMGKPARVKGRDLGKGLIAAIGKIRKFTKVKDVDMFCECAGDWEDHMVGTLSGRDGNEMKIQKIQDQVRSLIAIYGATGPKTWKDFDQAIDNIFSDDKVGITLSTVHRAKGLEANRVIILEPGSMPHKMARTVDQKEQEQNIRYIAMTRAKKSLVFVADKAKKKDK